MKIRSGYSTFGGGTSFAFPPVISLHDLRKNGYIKSWKDLQRNLDILMKKLQKYHETCRKFDQFSRDSAVEMAKAYVNVMALWTPPHISKKPLDKKSKEGKLLYKRTITYLPSILNKKRRGQENKFLASDVAAVREGKLFRVTIARSKYDLKAKYFKKKNRQAKAAATIHMRYLTRAAWGAGIDDQLEGAKIPPNIANVLSKNRDIKQKAKSLNKFTIYQDRGFYGVKIQNNTNTKEGGWFKIADKKAKEAAFKVEKKRMKQMERITKG